MDNHSPWDVQCHSAETAEFVLLLFLVRKHCCCCFERKLLLLLLLLLPLLLLLRKETAVLKHHRYTAASCSCCHLLAVRAWRRSRYCARAPAASAPVACSNRSASVDLP